MNNCIARVTYQKLTLALLVFFPQKGLISLVVWSLFDLDVSAYTGIVYLLVTGAFLFLTLLCSGIPVKNKQAMLFIIMTFIGVNFSILKMDTPFFSYVILLFALPIVLSWVKDVDDQFIIHLLEIFFKVTVVFILIELLVVQFNLFGDISRDELIKYQSIFTSRKDWDGLHLIYDGIDSYVYRTGGYLGNVLAMPPLVLFSFAYFYIHYNIERRATSFIWMILGIISLFATTSATVILSGLITVLFYEIIIKRKYYYIIIFLLCIFLMYLSVSEVAYTVNIFLENMVNPDYLKSFIGFTSSFTDMTILFIFGGWQSSLDGIPSHVEFVNVLFMFGMYPAFVLMKRWYRAIMFGLKVNYLYPAHIFSVMLLALSISFVHHSMGLTIYSMIIATIILLRIEYTWKAQKLLNKKVELVTGKSMQ